MTTDHIGRLSELIAAADLSRPVRGRFHRPLFRATPLGDKYPTVDFLVDLLDRSDESLGFFFVQIKGTLGPGSSNRRLAIEVPIARFNRLARIPAPTYLIGVDLVQERSYLVSANRTRTSGVFSITKSYCLGEQSVKMDLYKEVLTFWNANRVVLTQSRFRDD